MVWLGVALSIYLTDHGHAASGCGDVFITVLRDPPTMEFLTALRPHVRQHQERHGGPTRSLTLMEAGSIKVLTPSEIRSEADGLLRDYPGAGTAYVLEGSGFALAATRTLLAGFHMVKGRSGAYKIFATVGEGVEWLVKRAPAGPKPQQVLESLLVDAIERTRRAAAGE